jgi:flavin reductase (DIM6/NTAB) family NADH-FMN oxidoreductase RutF
MPRDIDPGSIGTADRYKLLIGGVVPRPIAFVSTVSQSGALNLAPFSFFNAVGSDPMTLLFCPANRPDGTDKDTLRNCETRENGGTGEFVVNIASDAYIREVAGAAEELPHGDSEFELTGLTPAPSARVTPPRVAESPLAYECETVQIVRTNPGAAGGGNVVIGRVVNVHIADDALVNDRYHVDAERLAAIGRMGGRTYCSTNDRFDLPWGAAALKDSGAQG